MEILDSSILIYLPFRCGLKISVKSKNNWISEADGVENLRTFLEEVNLVLLLVPISSRFYA